MRDDFPRTLVEILAKRVGYRCSNPNCRQLTSGPHTEDERSLNIGVAAHITAASHAGPRFDPSLTTEQRRGIDNGIWLCQNCAKLVDNDAVRYTKETLLSWKNNAERGALQEIESKTQRLEVQVRDANLEIKLRESFTFRSGAFFADQSRGVKLKNASGIPVTVRSVTLLAELNEGHHPLTLEFFPDKSKSPKGTELNERGWVRLPVATEACWIAPFREDFRLAGNFTICGSRVTVEYESPNGGTRLLEIDAEGRDVQVLKDLFQKYYDQLLALETNDSKSKNLGQEPPSAAGHHRIEGRATISQKDAQTTDWDLFISHASEDKDEIARPLADKFIEHGLKVWFDEYTLTVGDSLRRSIDQGLAGCRFGVVILSPHFLQKEWTQKELDGLVARDDGSEKRILPVWHNVSRNEVVSFSPPLADKLGVLTAKGLDHVVSEILRAIKYRNELPTRVDLKNTLPNRKSQDNLDERVIGSQQPTTGQGTGFSIEKAISDMTSLEQIRQSALEVEKSIQLSQSAEVDHVVLLIHGIRTEADWQEMVVRQLEGPSIRVFPIKYGFFDVFQFLIPGPTRMWPIQRVLKEVRLVRDRFRTAKLSIVAHSFGTYIVSQLVRDNFDIRLFRILFCGSVVPSTFAWEKVLRQITEDQVVNECGKSDIWPVFAQAVTWGYGATGTHGFGSVVVRDRYHPGGHSQYFDQNFVKKYWVPFLQRGEICPSDWEQSRPSTPWWLSFLGWLPLRYLALIAPIVTAMIVAWPQITPLFEPKQSGTSGIIPPSTPGSSNDVPSTNGDKAASTTVEKKGPKFVTTETIREMPQELVPATLWFEDKSSKGEGFRSFYGTNFFSHVLKEDHKLYDKLFDPSYQTEWNREASLLKGQAQLDAVISKLRELNPDVHLEENHEIEDNVVTELHLTAPGISDIYPLHVLMGLKTLTISDRSTSMSNLSFLHPLKHLKLKEFRCSGTRVFQLKALEKMPLECLYCDRTLITELSSLEGMSLTKLVFTPKNFNPQELAVIRRMPSLKSIGLDEKEANQFRADEFWNKYDAGEFGKKSH